MFSSTDLRVRRTSLRNPLPALLASVATAGPATAGWWYGPPEAAQSSASITYDQVAGGALPAPVAQAVGLQWLAPASIAAAGQDVVGASNNTYSLSATHWTFSPGFNMGSAGLWLTSLPRFTQLDFANALGEAELRLDFQVVVRSTDIGFWYDPLPNAMLVQYFVPNGSTAKFEAEVNVHNMTTGALLSNQNMSWTHNPAIHPVAGTQLLFDGNPAPVWIPSGDLVRYSGFLRWRVDHIAAGPMPGDQGVSVEIGPAPCAVPGYAGSTSNRECDLDEPGPSGPPCPADLDGNDRTDGGDAAAVLAAWGACRHECSADFDRSGFVDFADLIAVLASWGACP
jgi:hypothetical protein